MRGGIYNLYIPLIFLKVNKNLSKNDKFLRYDKNFSQKGRSFDFVLRFSVFVLSRLVLINVIEGFTAICFAGKIWKVMVR